MTELELRQKAAAVARSFLGKNEADGSFREIIDLYNKIVPLPRGYKMKYTDPWCAAFVSVVSYVCGFLSIMPAECSCDKMIDQYKKMGRWEENDAYVPELGDVIFYDWDDSGLGDDTGSSDHVGIVTAINGNQLTITEGNKNDSVGDRVISVNSRYIRGYGSPAYFVLSDENPEIPVEDDAIINKPKPGVRPDKKYLIELEELHYGSGLNDPNPLVESLQILLIGKKFPCGSAGADGEFGNGTLMAVKNFQEAKGLPETGDVDDNTWYTLLHTK